MDEKKKDLLSRVLDMDEVELRAALLQVIEGVPIDQAIDAAYNYIRHEARKLRRQTA